MKTLIYIGGGVAIDPERIDHICRDGERRLYVGLIGRSVPYKVTVPGVMETLEKMGWFVVVGKNEVPT